MGSPLRWSCDTLQTPPLDMSGHPADRVDWFDVTVKVVPNVFEGVTVGRG